MPTGAPPAPRTSHPERHSLRPNAAPRPTLAADQVTSGALITDRDLPRRFDVPSWWRACADQAPVADETEQFEPVWVRPAEALARHETGNFFMIFPTIRTLERLAKFDSADAVLQACAGEQPLWTSCPRGGLLNGAEARYMEHEMPHTASSRWSAPTGTSCTTWTGAPTSPCPCSRT
jgi:hypothetical protein